MKQLAAAVSMVLGLALLGFGALFLLGSDGQAHRLVIAALGTVLGLAGLAAGVWLIQRSLVTSPGRLRGQIMALARQRDGQVTWPDLQATLGEHADAGRSILGQLLLDGTCERQDIDGTEAFVFPALQPRLVRRRCSHCGYEAALDSSLEGCPSCGASLTIARDAVEVDGLYGMDE